ncbi:hypothetical protein Ddc_23401 [Ditylenchus destructor]|nr:hypothetical protein Ddc_23401 [Ditylenchus destructor]
MKASSSGILIEMLLILDLFSSLTSADLKCVYGWTECKTTGIFIKNHKCPHGTCVPYVTDNGVKMQCCKPDNHKCAHCDKKNGDLKCKAAVKSWKKKDEQLKKKLSSKTHEVRCNFGCCQERERVKKQKVSVGAGGGDISFAWTYMWITMFFA